MSIGTDRNILAEESNPPMAGTWIMFAPDGRKWEAESPLKLACMEQRERIPDEVAVKRIFKEADRWCEGTIELKREEDHLIVSVERCGKYVEVIREYEPDGGPIGHAVHPSGIDSALEKAGLL